MRLLFGGLRNSSYQLRSFETSIPVALFALRAASPSVGDQTASDQCRHSEGDIGSAELFRSDTTGVNPTGRRWL